MNNDLKYAVNGVLLTVLFFIAVGFVSYLLSIQQTELKPKISKADEAILQIVSDKEDPKFSKGKRLYCQR